MKTEARHDTGRHQVGMRRLRIKHKVGWTVRQRQAREADGEGAGKRGEKKWSVGNQEPVVVGNDFVATRFPLLSPLWVEHHGGKWGVGMGTRGILC